MKQLHDKVDSLAMPYSAALQLLADKRANKPSSSKRKSRSRLTKATASRTNLQKANAGQQKELLAASKSFQHMEVVVDVDDLIE